MSESIWKGALESSAYEWTLIISFVFGGCCSNVWALESLLQKHPKSGTFLTFAQFLYVTLQTISTQLYIPPKGSRPLGLPFPVLQPRKVPIRRWMVQVAFFLAISLMNNIAFGMKIPVTVNIIFRSGGLCVSMLIGWLFGGRKYGVGQVLAGLMITTGIVVATVSAPRKRGHGGAHAAGVSEGDHWEYLGGIGLLTTALVLAALMGLFQEETYRRYGKQWRESLFYSHFLSLPFFIPLYPAVSSTFVSFLQSPPTTLISLPDPTTINLASFDQWGKPLTGWKDIVVPSALLALMVNVVTQGICVRGVNRLAARVNNVTVNLVLTLRKALSLAISVWYYGSGFNTGIAVGGGMVLGGTILYSLAPGPSKALEAADKKMDEKSRETNGAVHNGQSNSTSTATESMEIRQRKKA